MSHSGRTSPSLSAPSAHQTARQRLSSNNSDEDFRPLVRGSVPGAVARSKQRKSPLVPRSRARPRLEPQEIVREPEDEDEVNEDDDKSMLPESTNRKTTRPAVPDGPPAVSAYQSSILNDVSTVCSDESYGADEKALNDFLRVHPMLSLEATNHETLQLVANMCEKAPIKVPDLEIISYTYDSSYLRPANTQIGERPCACGDKCICLFMARIRHGSETPLAFMGTEFLLPSEKKNFMNGNVLPPRRKKCLICTRYFTNLLYIQFRTDPTFKLSSAPLDLQAFGNVCCTTHPNDKNDPNLEELGKQMSELPMSASMVHARDGYKPSAMLFVDEDFSVSSRASREGATAALMWRPVVRFCSSHYKYQMGEKGPYIVQVGISADDHTGTGLGFSSFVQPSTGVVAPSAAERLS